uniref:Uncharacterized protein n=1 Tax=Caenorhabditis tropicalis TaxID=1561998 RepID=A0A1I7TDY8_9PELO
MSIVDYLILIQKPAITDPTPSMLGKVKEEPKNGGSKDDEKKTSQENKEGGGGEGEGAKKEEGEKKMKQLRNQKILQSNHSRNLRHS